MRSVESRKGEECRKQGRNEDSRKGEDCREHQVEECMYIESRKGEEGRKYKGGGI
jgi:hypothetical protein